MIGQYSERKAWLEAKHKPWIPTTIWNEFEKCADSYPESHIIEIVNGSALSYREAKNKAEQFARSMMALGIRPQESVGIRLSSGEKIVICIIALAKLGAKSVFISQDAGEDETAHILMSSKARALVCDSPLQEAPDGPAVSRSASTAGIYLLNSHNRPLKTDHWIAWDDALLLANRIQPWEGTFAKPESVASVLFTSGSSGMPKGALLSHDQLLRSAWANALNRGFEEGRRILSLVPMNHCFCYVEGFLAILFVGGTLVLNEGAHDACSIISAIDQHEVNDILSVPYVLGKVLDYLDALDRRPRFETLHAMYCGGEKCAYSFWGRLRSGFGVEDIVNGYGMTETCGAIMQTPPRSQRYHPT